MQVYFTELIIFKVSAFGVAVTVSSFMPDVLPLLHAAKMVAVKSVHATIIFFILQNCIVRKQLL